MNFNVEVSDFQFVMIAILTGWGLLCLLTAFFFCRNAHVAKQRMDGHASEPRLWFDLHA